MNRKTIIALIAATGVATAATSAAVAAAISYEEEMARQEESLIIRSPIAGIRNDAWFDYRTNVLEAKDELASDLRNVSDAEDMRDTWDEYRHELSHERRTYVHKMAKRGYRYGEVRVGDY